MVDACSPAPCVNALVVQGHAMMQAKVDARRMTRILTAWKDCTRLKLISLPHYHLYGAMHTGSWGAGAAYWRLVELREAERHAAQSMAHHAAAMERARADSHRVQIEMARASGDTDYGHYKHGVVAPVHAGSAYQHILGAPPSSLPPSAYPPAHPLGRNSSAAVNRYLASLSSASPAPLPAGYAPSPALATTFPHSLSGSSSVGALADSTALARLRADLAIRSGAAGANGDAAALLNRTLVEQGYPYGAPLPSYTPAGYTPANAHVYGHGHGLGGAPGYPMSASELRNGYPMSASELRNGYSMSARQPRPPASRYDAFLNSSGGGGGGFSVGSGASAGAASAGEREAKGGGGAPVLSRLSSTMLEGIAAWGIDSIEEVTARPVAAE